MAWSKVGRRPKAFETGLYYYRATYWDGSTRALCTGSGSSASLAVRLADEFAGPRPALLTHCAILGTSFVNHRFTGRCPTLPLLNN